MNRNDIIRMARETGMISDSHASGMISFLERFSALVAEKTAEEFKPLFDSMRAASNGMAQTAGKIAAFEREECAKLCEELDGYQYARAIRARGKK